MRANYSLGTPEDSSSIRESKRGIASHERGTHRASSSWVATEFSQGAHGSADARF